MKLATLCYIKNKDKTLMLFRNKKKNDYHKGKWNGLGGKFKQGESPEECVKREVYEESGLTPEKVELKAILTFPMFDNIEDWYVFVFITTKFKGEIIDSKEGTLKWHNTDELLRLNLWEGDKIFIPLLEKNKFFTGKFEYKNGKLINYNINLY